MSFRDFIKKNPVYGKDERFCSLMSLPLLPARSTFLLDSPLGPLRLVADDRVLWEVSFSTEPFPGSFSPIPAQVPPNPILAQAAIQLTEYFAGQRQAFELPLAWDGDHFQQRVWAELRSLHFGQTTTFSSLARRLGDALAVRAVSRAVGVNPLVIVVPSHRAIGTGGKLTSFSGGIERKRWLLTHEGVREGHGILF